MITKSLGKFLFVGDGSLWPWMLGGAAAVVVGGAALAASRDASLSHCGPTDPQVRPLPVINGSADESAVIYGHQLICLGYTGMHAGDDFAREHAAAIAAYTAGSTDPHRVTSATLNAADDAFRVYAGLPRAIDYVAPSSGSLLGMVRRRQLRYT